MWAAAGAHAPDAGTDADRPLIIDLDATLITSHSDKQLARPTFKRGYGFHPLCAFADHGADGTGEALAILLRPGNAGSNTAVDHIAVIRDALRQLPGHRPGGSGGPEGVDPHRFGRVHPRRAQVSGRAAAVLLGRVSLTG